MNVEIVRSLVNLKDLEIQPLEQAETIPSAWYTDAAFHDLDCEAVFATTWQHVGHTSKLLTPGDQIIGTVGRDPVLAVRDNDYNLRAFFNVCRHRGGPLAQEDCRSKVLQCKYHGWTYLLDGSLRGTPKFDRTELFNKKDYGLVPLVVDAWEEMVFVGVREPAVPLAKVMEGIRERIAPSRLPGKHFYRRVPYEVRCNWKVYVDNYLEGYHLPFVHPELTTMLDYQNYITETSEHYSLQQSAIAQKDRVYGDGTAYYYFIYPNFMLNILPGRVQTNMVQPLGPDRCRVVFDYYYDDIASEAALRRIRDDMAYADHVQGEDAEICERVQAGLASRAYDKGRFSPDMENGVHHFQTLLKLSYRRALHG